MTTKIISVLLIFAAWMPLHGQNVKSDSVKSDTTTLKRTFVPMGLRIGMDMVSLVKAQIQNDFTGWEVSGDIDIHRYLLSAEVGSWGRNFRRDSASYSSTYQNTGRFWRAGIDVNFLTRDPERNAFFIGARYAHAKYSESMAISATDSIWGPITGNYSNKDLTARWFELDLGVKVKIYKFIWFGYRGSLKLGLKKNENAAIMSHDVPGYGSTGRDTAWGFTYSIYFRIPFRETRPILPPKKK
jgi:hypothetical protein